jgi:hypothetical protein
MSSRLTPSNSSAAIQYLLRYAQEASWRKDCRRLSNGEQVSRVAGLAMMSKPSVDFAGYWQRHIGRIG